MSDRIEIQGKTVEAAVSEAMRQLGVTPNQCIAFEDSPSGARSARSSGAHTVGLRSRLDAHSLRQAGAHLTLPDFTDPALPPLLGAHIGATS